MNITTKTQRLALKFSTLLLQEIGKEHFLEAIELNKEEDNDCCHSHDHCDANIVMLDALEVLGYNERGEYGQFFSDACENLFNEAWTHARKYDFYVSMLLTETEDRTKRILDVQKKEGTPAATKQFVSEVTSILGA